MDVKTKTIKLIATNKISKIFFSKLSGFQVAFYFAIIEEMDDKNIAFINVEKACKKLSVKDNIVRDTIQQLERNGLIVIVKLKPMENKVGVLINPCYAYSNALKLKEVIREWNKHQINNKGKWENSFLIEVKKNQ